jgi:hypothetical protein
MFLTAPNPKTIFPKFTGRGLTRPKNTFWARNVPKPCFGKAYGTDFVQALGLWENCLNSGLENEPERDLNRLRPESTVELFKLLISLE